MAQMPIEVAQIGNVPSDAIRRIIARANSLQNEFVYISLPEETARGFRPFEYTKVDLDHLLNAIEQFRVKIRGYHPYLIVFIDSQLTSGRFTNLFWGMLSHDGLAVVTIANVPDVIIPAARMAAYYLHTLAISTFYFIAPGHKSHDATRGCAFDFNNDKVGLLKSMKARALCDDCRRTLVNGRVSLLPQHLDSLDRMFEEGGRLIERVRTGKDIDALPKTFIGSSTEGLSLAKALSESLRNSEIAASEVWNEGTIFGLGAATLEALEQAVLQYDFGVFIFTPDDELRVRGKLKRVARDNVILELGLFIGKLTRRRAFIIRPSKKTIQLPSDLLGITTAEYDPDVTNLTVALKPACKQIRIAIDRANSQLRR